MNLAELIRTAKGDRSYEQLARDCGGRPTAARLQQIATSPARTFPDPPTIRGLASGLRVTETTVVLSAAETLGLDVRLAGGRLVALLPAGTERLTDEQVDAVLTVIRSMLKTHPRMESAALRHARLDVEEFRKGMTDTPGARAHLQELEKVVQALELAESMADSDVTRSRGSESAL